MDVLGLADASDSDHRLVHAEFKEQLYQNKEGWYETGQPRTQALSSGKERPWSELVT